MLAITEGSDSVLLLHCFSCGDVHGILNALRLTVGDLFPAKLKDTSPDGRRQAREAFRRSAWDAALTVLNREAYVVEIAAHDLSEGNVLSNVDHERLLVSCGRVHGAREALR